MAREIKKRMERGEKRYMIGDKCYRGIWGYKKVLESHKSER